MLSAADEAVSAPQIDRSAVWEGGLQFDKRIEIEGDDDASSYAVGSLRIEGRVMIAFVAHARGSNRTLLYTMFPYELMDQPNQRAQVQQWSRLFRLTERELRHLIPRLI